MIEMRPWRKNLAKWLVWRPEEDETIDDAQEVRSSDAEEAAEDWAEWSDSGGDYTIVGGSEATVCVRAKDDDAAPVETFVVTGESVPQYTARAPREKRTERA